MKFLVLSCNTGQGHNSAARAVCEKMLSLGHSCEVKDALLYCSKMVSDGVSESYNKIVLYTPRAFGIGYRHGKNKIYKYGKTKSAFYAMNMAYSKRLYNDVVENKYDAVICCHLFPAQAITHAKHKHGLNVPVYVVATDYSFSPYYDELDVDGFFVSMKEVMHEYVERGIPNDKIVASGIPVSERFLCDFTREQARAELGLPKDRFLCLIMSGSMGFGKIFNLIDEIIKRPLHDYDILVIAGNNNKLKNGINEKYVKNGNIAALGYTDKVHLYMKASNLVITKPGGLSSTEAMVSNVPIILTSPIPGCESENYETLTKFGTALEGACIDKAVMAFEQVLFNDYISDAVIENQKKYINKNSAETVCKTIINRLSNKYLNIEEGN